MEKRNFARLPMNSETSITVNHTTISGTVQNLSMKGAFVRTAITVPVDTMVEVSIYTSAAPSLLCDLQARVVRSTEYGIGLEFEKTVLD